MGTNSTFLKKHTSKRKKEQGNLFLFAFVRILRLCLVSQNTQMLLICLVLEIKINPPIYLRCQLAQGILPIAAGTNIGPISAG